MKKKLSKQKGLWINPRSKAFWFRRAVPEDIQPQIGKTMVKFSLQTSDLRLAEDIAERWWLQTDDDFYQARHGNKIKNIPINLSKRCILQMMIWLISPSGGETLPWKQQKFLKNTKPGMA